jgi:ATP phosphoribosyltransferase
MLCKNIDNIVKSKEWIIKQKEKQEQILYEELKESVLENIRQKTLNAFRVKNKEIDKILQSLLNKNKDPYSASEELSLLIFSNK